MSSSVAAAAPHEHAAPQSVPRRARRTSLLICLALTLLNLGLYARTLTYPFVDFDDYDFVRNNEHVNRGLTRDGFVWAFAIHGPSQYHPLTYLSHMLDAELFG